MNTLLEMNVEQIATMGKVLTVDADTPLDEACHMLASRRIKKLPVVENGKLVGTLSRRNVIHAISENAPR
jgi:CBS domain-containing protein